MPRIRSSFPHLPSAITTFILLVIVVGCLYWAKPVLVPIALAVLITFLLSPVVVWLQHRGLPRALAVTLAVGSSGLVLVSFLWILTAQFVSLANQLPTYQEKVAQRIAKVREQGEDSLFSKLQTFAERITTAATQSPDADEAFDPPQRVEVVTTQGGWDPFPFVATLSPIIEPLAASGLVLVLVVLMLINREDLRNRLLRLIGNGHLTLTTRALDDAGQRVSRFLLVQFLLNCGFGVVVGLGLFLLGLPYAILWGFLAAVLRYIPIIGPWILAIFPLTFSLLISDGWQQPAAILAMIVVCELINNLILEPWLFGRSIGVSQAALLMAIAFWTWLWGAMGLVMAAPLTVCLVVLGKYVPQLKFFDILLGDEPALTADINFYQRLLAHDADEASEIVSEQAKTLPPMQLYDEVFIPALVYSKQDVAEGRLDDVEATAIWNTAGELAEVQDLKESATAEGVDVVEPQQRLTILGCGARDRADEVALAIFQRLLDPQICQLQVVSQERLVSEIVEQVDEERPAIICIVALPPGGLAHTRLLCKRLRQRFPKLKIVVARWGLHDDIGANRDQLLAAGADHFGTSLEETSKHLVQLAQSLKPLTTTEDWSKPAGPVRERLAAPAGSAATH